MPPDYMAKWSLRQTPHTYGDHRAHAEEQRSRRRRRMSKRRMRRRRKGGRRRWRASFCFLVAKHPREILCVACLGDCSAQTSSRVVTLRQ